MGIGHKTLADCGRELQQHVEFRAVRLEPEQRAVKREHEHRLLFRLPFGPDGSVQGRFTVQEKERDLFPFW